ncbi:hypothetical protein [Pseudomonas monsensis]
MALPSEGRQRQPENASVGKVFIQRSCFWCLSVRVIHGVLLE